METTLNLLPSAAIEGRLPLERVVHLLAESPARLYGLYPCKGHLAPGADADLVLVDPSA
jgi:dihydroorotase-like cyclic amidohydrolase